MKWQKMVENISISEQGISGTKIRRESIEQYRLIPSNNP